MSQPITTERQRRVEAERQAWIKKLIDVSRRNNLLYFRPLKTGTLDLSFADKDAVAALLEGGSISLRQLLGSSADDLDGGDEEATPIHKLKEIARRALLNKEEKGLQTMFVAFGSASWPAEGEGRPVDAPILLQPVELEIRGRGGAGITFHNSGSLQLNLVLLHVLEAQLGLELSAEDLLPTQVEEHAFETGQVYERLRKVADKITGFNITDRSVLGNFTFQKMAMVRDLQSLDQQLPNHDVIAAIAGDLQSRQKISESQKDLDPRDLDSVAPENEFAVMDADSSQQSAMSLALSGQDAVIHGPPGTGKSQTIANLIASFAAHGKKVLFVAEKRAALEVVLHRLNSIGLGHLAIDLHGADLSPKRVLRQIAAALDLVRSSAQIDCVQLHQRFQERRARLNGHAERMHHRRAPCDETIYEMQGKLLRLPALARAETRWRSGELNALTSTTAETIRDLLREAGGLASLFLRTDPSPWTLAVLTNGAAAQAAMDLVQDLHRNQWPTALSSLKSLAKSAGLRVPETLDEAKSLCEVLAGVQSMLAVYSSSLFKLNLTELAKDLAPGKAGGIKGAWAWVVNPDLRSARNVLLGLRISGKTTTRELASEVARAIDLVRRWTSLSGDASLPCAVSALGDHAPKVDAALSALTQLALVLPDNHIPELALSDITELLGRLADDGLTPHKIPKVLNIAQALTKHGVGKLVEEIRTRPGLPEYWLQMFDYCWRASCLDLARLTDPEIAGFNGRTHDQFVKDFAELDQERLRLASARVRRASAERAIGTMNAYPAEDDLVRRESQKSRRLLPLRRLFAQAPHVLTALCPCWMASPLSVSQVLDAKERYFDVVIFDEASQVLPEDAIPSIVRASKVIVAGDANQLPPTAFFVADDDEPEYGDEDQTPTGTSGFESLLDTMNAFVRSRPLDWHYRSRDESLISFSNYHIYGGRLVTFPGPGGSPAIRHVLVDQIPDKDGEEESSGVEVRRVVDLIFEHATLHPEESLGVITMGIKHADRLQRALDQECAQRGSPDGFFDPNLQERFFIKNLERVQGDERDAIIVSIGYGKDRGGNLKFRFGPLLSIGGRRRLNVAITRARRRLTLVSSFSHLDMDPARVRAGTGVDLLRHYLEYAATAGRRLSDAEVTDVPLNAFEAEVFDVLTAQGISLIPQMGASRFRIDLVAQHPSKPGRFVLAIECDGATYHSSPTARDRDRLRQTQLENLGWRFHRIWSTDWFMRKDEEVRRAVSAYEAAVKFADRAVVPADSGPVNSGDESTNQRTPANGTVSCLGTRKARPLIPRRDSIDEYTLNQLIALVLWINSDGRLRTDEQIIDEILPELGFSRRGVRIENAIHRAIRCADGLSRAK